MDTLWIIQRNLIGSSMINILVTSKINALYIRILGGMYLNQILKVSYNEVTSTMVSVSNGIKQGSVLSSTLFKVYVDGIC